MGATPLPSGRSVFLNIHEGMLVGGNVLYSYRGDETRPAVVGRMRYSSRFATPYS